MKHFLATIIVVAGLLGLASTSPVFALTVSPTILEVSGDAGSTVTTSIDLYNDQDKKQDLYISFENFEPDGDTGAPRFMGNDSGLATWFSSANFLTLRKGERNEVPFTLTIPADTEPGGYFAAIFFGNQPPATDDSEVTIGGRIGVLVLLRVNGDIPEEAGVVGFSTIGKKKFYTMPPVEFTYQFSNRGGDRVVPLGDIVMTNTIGRKRSSILANPTDGSVLPSSARRFIPTWKTSDVQPEGFFATAKEQWKHFHFGWYTAYLNLGWGIMDHSSSNAYSFFMFPWQLLLLVLVIGLVTYIVIKFTLKTYKKSLIKELQKQQEESNKEILSKNHESKKLW